MNPRTIKFDLQTFPSPRLSTTLDNTGWRPSQTPAQTEPHHLTNFSLVGSRPGMDISSLQAFQGGAGCNLKPSSFPGGPWLQPQAFMLSKGGPGRNLKPSSFPGGPWLQPQAFKIARGGAGCNLKASSFPGGPWLQPQAFMLFRGGPGRNLKLSSLDPLDSWTPGPLHPPSNL